MARKTGASLVLAIVMPLLTTVQAPAQAQGVGSCPAGMQSVPAGLNRSGNAVAAYCAAAPTQGTYDPYTGPNAPDPNAERGDGPGQFIPRTR